ELSSVLGRQFVKSRLAVVFRSTPLGRKPALYQVKCMEEKEKIGSAYRGTHAEQSGLIVRRTRSSLDSGGKAPGTSHSPSPKCQVSRNEAQNFGSRSCAT